MNSKIQKMGKGFQIETRQHYLDSEWVDVETVDVDLRTMDYGHIPIDKISTDNANHSPAEPGSILRVGEYGSLEWASPSQIFADMDKELREKYSGLEIAWEKVLEAVHDYELVKKLVKDHE